MAVDHLHNKDTQRLFWALFATFLIIHIKSFNCFQVLGILPRLSSFRLKDASENQSDLGYRIQLFVKNNIFVIFLKLRSDTSDFRCI